MEYQDFTIDVRSAEGGRFEARVIDAPLGGNPRVFFPPPLSQEDLKTLHGLFDGSGKEAPEKPSPKALARQMGQQLHTALFRDGVAELYQKCRATLLSDKNTGLRLRLKFQLKDTEAGYLAALPWEWLCDPASCELLATDPCTPVVRDIAVPRPQGTLEVAGPLRVLVVASASSDMGLDLEQEIERMAAALKPLEESGKVKLVRLATADPNALREALKDDKIHVLHFMGHGGYDPESGNGAVIFAQEGAGKDQVSGEPFATYLKELPSLRLVVLNACKTARYASRRGPSLNHGLAPVVLERTRVPAVVANQYTISDTAAIAFSETFYRRIAKGDPVDEALTEARLQLYRTSAEWATPVLFLAAPHGRLFALGAARSDNGLVHREKTEMIRLGVRSFDGFGGDMKARNEAVLELAGYFDGRYIKRKEDWQEKIFPELRAFLLRWIDPHRPLLLDFAAHSSIAFAAGWVLEPKSGLDVRVSQRISGEGVLDWHPKDGTEPDGSLWLDRPDIELDPEAPDVALALSASQPDVAGHVQDFVQRKSLSIGRIVDATVAPEPGPHSVRGGAHALGLAQALLPRLRPRKPHERKGRTHLFCAAPNALVFYLGQLASSLGRVVLYEFAFRAEDSFGRYQQSIELPPPGEASQIPGDDW